MRITVPMDVEVASDGSTTLVVEAGGGGGGRSSTLLTCRMACGLVGAVCVRRRRSYEGHRPAHRRHCWRNSPPCAAAS